MFSMRISTLLLLVFSYLRYVFLCVMSVFQYWNDFQSIRIFLRSMTFNINSAKEKSFRHRFLYFLLYLFPLAPCVWKSKTFVKNLCYTIVGRKEKIGWKFFPCVENWRDRQNNWIEEIFFNIKKIKIWSYWFEIKFQCNYFTEIIFFRVFFVIISTRFVLLGIFLHSPTFPIVVYHSLWSCVNNISVSNDEYIRYKHIQHSHTCTLIPRWIMYHW